MDFKRVGEGTEKRKFRDDHKKFNPVSLHLVFLIFPFFFFGTPIIVFCTNNVSFYFIRHQSVNFDLFTFTVYLFTNS